MHHQYFPPCPVKGPIEPPVPFCHLGLNGAVPNKCSTCKHLFEGSCRRYIEQAQKYLHLDYGPCGIHGPTDPVLYEDQFIRSKVEIPRKCLRCRFLFHHSIYGFTCNKDSEKWGAFHRGLDWGHWSPSRFYIELPYPKKTTKALIDCLHENNLVEFIKECRRINPGSSILEAKEDHAYLSKTLSDLSRARDSA